MQEGEMQETRDWKFNDRSVLTLINNFLSNETVCLSRMVHFYASDYHKIHSLLDDGSASSSFPLFITSDTKASHGCTEAIFQSVLLINK